jgi:hypothetical protein
MKKQRFMFLAAIALVFTCLQSCDDNPNKDAATIEANEVEKEVAIEVDQEKVSQQYLESIFSESNNEFSQGDFIQNLPNRKAMRTSTEQVSDTIKSADEIPTYTSENINQKIYTDGTYQYLSENTSPIDSNIFNALNVELQPAEEVVVKTIAKDGVVYLYNKNEEIIQKEQSGNINYGAMLDTIKNVLAAEKNNQTSGVNGKTMQSRRIAKAMSSAKASGMRMISRSNKEVIMEMNLGSSTQSVISQRKKSAVQKKAIMRFSGDLSRMLEQKIYEDNQLVESVQFEYQVDNQKFSKKATAAVRDILPTSSVKAITYKSLILKNNGTPHIMITKENYKKNQITINL